MMVMVMVNEGNNQNLMVTINWEKWRDGIWHEEGDVGKIREWLQGDKKL